MICKDHIPASLVNFVCFSQSHQLLEFVLLNTHHTICFNLGMLPLSSSLQRNYRSFLLFIYTAAILCLYVIACCLTQLFVKHGQVVDDAHASGDDSSTAVLWLRTVGGVIPALVVAGYCFIFFWFVGGLSLFHAYLISTNQTTYENFRWVKLVFRGSGSNAFLVGGLNEFWEQTSVEFTGDAGGVQ